MDQTERPGNLLLPSVTEAASEQNPIRHSFRKASSRPCFSRQFSSSLVFLSMVVFSSSRRSKKKVNSSELLTHKMFCLKVSFGQVSLILAKNVSLVSFDRKHTTSVHVTFE